MAQSAANLMVTIGGDSSKLKADLKLLGAQIKETGRQMQAAVKSGDTAAVEAYHKSYAELNRQLLQTDTALKKTTAATTAQTAATRQGTSAAREHGRSLREYGRGFAELSREAGVTIEGMRALKFGFAGLGVALAARQFNDAIKSINDLNNAIKAIPGGKPEELKSLQKAVEQDGQAADVATRAYTAFNKAAAESHVRALEAGRIGTGGTTIARGGQGPQGISLQELTTVGRGGRDTGQIDWTDPYKAVTGRERTKDRTADNLLLAKSILAIKDATLQDIATQKNYNVTFEEYRKILERTVAGTLPKEEPVTAPQKKTMEEYNQLVAEGKQLWNDSAEAVARVAAGIVVATSKAETYNNTIKARLADPTMGELPFAAQPGGRQEVIARVPPRTDASGSDFSGGPGYASGGYIRGPGTGTSDSIAARLSNGEFVLNAASVRNLGVGFLQGLNNFAMGGLVGAPPIRFAEGGLVSAASSSGRPVHLHLGSQAFALSGSSGVVDALVSHANAQQMRSAGVKPSWFAGRPGGR
jgi:hypothetical protein